MARRKPPSEPEEAKTWARQYARGSIVAPLAAVLVSALVRQMIGQIEDQQVGGWLNLVSGTLVLTLIVLGFVLGILGFLGGRRRGSRDTMIIACLGLFASGGLILLTVWVTYFVWTMRRV